MSEDGVDTRGVAFYLNGDLPGPASESNQTVTVSGVVAQSDKGGTVTFSNGQITYRPAADFNGVDTFYYLVTDNGTSQTVFDPKTSRGTVTVNVGQVDDAPRVVQSFGTMNMVEDDSERALPLANYFFDPDVVPNDDVLTYRVVSNTNVGLVEPTFGANDVFIRPKADQNGQAVIVFEASDKAGNKVQNTLTVNVTPVNDAPRLGSPMPNLSIAEDAVVADITLTPSYFVDPDTINGDVLTFTVTNSNTEIVTATIVNGKLRLVLVPDASGVATITVRATDSTGNLIEDSFDITIAPVNDAPRVVDDLVYTTPQGVALRTTDARGTLTTTRNDDGVLANDRDIEGNAFTARLTVAPTKGTVTLNTDGTFTYTPNATTLTGAVDSFRYEAIDSLGAVSTQATVSVTITNPPPPRHQNPIQNLDVDADGFISPIDALIVINFINFNGSSVSVVGLPDPPPYRDVNGNNVIEPLDVLSVINYINNRRNGGAGEGAGEGEGESAGLINSASPLGWTTDVLRDAGNIATTMLPVSGTARPATAAQPAGLMAPPPAQMSLAEYLASFGDEDEDEQEVVESLISRKSGNEDTESLDSFFAEVFGN
jgi:VCBS repeat-containing protein